MSLIPPVTGRFRRSVSRLLSALLSLGFVATVSQSAIAQTDEETLTELLDATASLLDESQFEEALVTISEAAQLADLPNSIDIRAHLLDDDSETVRLILLRRAMANEGIRQYAEARHDYMAFLAMETDGEVADLIRARVALLNTESTKSMALLARIDEEQLARYYDYESSRYTIGVFPFQNVASSPVFTRVGYGISAYLSSTLELLKHFTDQPFEMVERSRLSAALSEVSLGRYYSADSPIPPPRIARLLGSEFLVAGTIDLEGGSLVANAQLGTTAYNPIYQIEEQQAAYSPDGLQELQTSLTLSVVDQLQELTGFNWVPSRAAFEDSVRTLILDDIQRFVAYGRSFQESLNGRLEDAERTLIDAGIREAATDRQAFSEPGPELADGELLTDLVSATGRRQPYEGEAVEEARNAASRASEEEDDSPVMVLPSPGAGAAARALAGASAMGQAGIGNAVVGATGPGRASGDPRDGVAGSLYAVESGDVTITVRVPLPPANRLSLLATIPTIRR